jgi:CheY-like chemotaxis protein
VVPAAGQRLRFEVHDSGSGITMADQAALFKPFSQVDASPQRRHGGSGLGLSICLELAQAMGGDVGVISGPGAGSCFWVELPLPAAAPAPADPAPASLPALAGVRVLVVEDNPVNMMITVALLEDWGVDVVQAGDGRAAVDEATTALRAGRAFDVVLMDLQMPGMDGLAAARELRARGQALPLVALTASVMDRDSDEALAAGIDEVLTKPLDATQLHQVLARVLSGRAAAA